MTDVKASDDAAAVSTRERPHLGVLLQRARRRIDEDVARRLGEAGFAGLRPGHSPVFSFLPLDGARLTDLARRARMTKQAMGELVRELEVLGYVERAPDAHDGRAKIIRFTPKGRRADEVGIFAIRDLEERWAAAIGAKRIRALRATLVELEKTSAES